jgi:hypothetical protein
MKLTFKELVHKQQTMSPIVKCAEAIKDRTTQESPTDGFETVLFDELPSNASGTSTSSGYVPENDCYLNNALKVIRNGHWEELSQIMSASPKICTVRFSTTESSKNFLIHEACKAGPPVWILEKIASGNKEAVTKRGDGGYLPLHFACANSASADAVAFLIGKFPGSVHMVESTDRMLPLHLASKFGISEEAMMVLLSSFPEATMVKDGFGRTPMDFAKSQTNPPLRNATISYLERGGWLCSASASARHWAELAHNKKLEELEQDMETAIARLESEIKEERTKLEKNVLSLETVIDSKDKEIDSLEQIMKTHTAQLGDDVDRELQTVVSLQNDLEAKEDKLVIATINNFNLKAMLQRKEDAQNTTGAEEIDALRNQVEYLYSLMASIRHLTSPGPQVSGSQGLPKTPRDFWKEKDRHSVSTIQANPFKQVVRTYEKRSVENKAPMNESRADSFIVDEVAQTRE